MLIPLKGNCKIRDFLSLPEILFLIVIISTFGFFIYVDHYFPKKNITIIAESSYINVKTQALTVREALNEAGIILDSKSLVVPSVEKKLQEGETIQVIKKSYKTMVEDEVVLPPPPSLKKSDSLENGETKLLVSSRQGVKRKYYLETYYNGELAKKSLISERTIISPRGEILLVGTGYRSKNVYISNKKKFKNRLISADVKTAADGSIIFIPDIGYFKVTNSDDPQLPKLVFRSAVKSQKQAYFLK